MDQFGECDNATSDAQHPLLYGGTFIHLQYHMFMETCRYESGSRHGDDGGCNP